MGMTSMVGGSMMMGIQMFLDARRVVSGAKEAEQAVQRIQITAKNAGVSVNNLSQNLSSTLQGIGVGMTMAGYAAQAAGRAIVGGFLQPSYREAVKYEDALTSMRTVLRYTKEEMLGVRKTIEANAMGGMYDFTEVTLAATRLAAFTGEAGKLNEQLPILMKFMTTVGKDLDPEMAARTMSGFYGKWRATGITFEQMGDQLIKLANVTALEFRDLPQILRSSRDIASSLNIKFNEFGALVGILREGLSPAEAARSAAGFARALNTATGAMAEYANKKNISFAEAMTLGKTDKKAKQIVQAVSTLGVQFFDATGKAKNFTTIIEETLAAASNLKKKGDMREYQRIMLRVFKDQAKNVMSSLDMYERGGKKAADGFKTLAKELLNSEGYLTWAAKVMGEAPGNIEKRWSAALNRMRASFGKPLMEMFIPIISKLADFMDGVTKFAAENPLFAKGIGILTTALAGLLVVAGTLTVVLGSIALWTSFILPAFTSAAVGSGVAASGVAAFTAKVGVATSAVGKWAGVIGLLTVSYLEFQKNFKTGTLDRFTSKFKSMGLVIQGIAEWWGGKDTKGSRSLYRRLKAAGLLGVVEMFLQVKRVVGEVIEGALKPLSIVLTIIGGVMEAILAPLSLAIDGFATLFLGAAKGSDSLRERLPFWRAIGSTIGVYLAASLALVATNWGLAAAAALRARLAFIAASGPIGWIITAAIILAGILGSQDTWEGMFTMMAKVGIFFTNLVNDLIYQATKFGLWIKTLLPASMGGMSEEQYNAVLAKLPKPVQWGDSPEEIAMFKNMISGGSEQATAIMMGEIQAKKYEKETGFRAPGINGDKSLPDRSQLPPMMTSVGKGELPAERFGPVREGLTDQGWRKPKPTVINVTVNAQGTLGLDKGKLVEAITSAVGKGTEASSQVNYGGHRIGYR